MRSRRRQRSHARSPGRATGIGGAAPARSALTLRAILAAFGLVFCSASAVVMHLAGVRIWVVAVLVVLAVAAAVDLVVILRRKRRGEPG